MRNATKANQYRKKLSGGAGQARYDNKYHASHWMGWVKQ
jgi:hypothetical protein